jgi:hypothetical protein
MIEAQIQYNQLTQNYPSALLTITSGRHDRSLLKLQSCDPLMHAEQEKQEESKERKSARYLFSLQSKRSYQVKRRHLTVAQKIKGRV